MLSVPITRPTDEGQWAANPVLSWAGLGVSAEGRVLLGSLSGCARPGRVLAIMGPSGAGKTTLLNALGGRLGRASGRVRVGTVRVGGVPISAVPPSHVGFVPQDDVLLPTDTPRSAVDFALRMRGHEDPAAVEGMVRRLGLGACADTAIGRPGDEAGISGGERRRTSIGVELAGGAPLLLLDEPTSGLDASSGLAVSAFLAQLAREGRTVVYTVHQPTAAMLRHVDDLLLLVAGGRPAFHGPLTEAVSYFAALGHPCPAHHTPTDHYLRLVQEDAAVAVDLAGRWDVHARRAAAAAAGLLNREEGTDSTALCWHLLPAEGPAVGAAATATAAADVVALIAPPRLQAKALLGRALRSVYGDRLFVRITIVQHIVISLIAGIIFNTLAPTVTGIQDRRGLLFMVCFIKSFTHSLLSFNRFRGVREVFVREQQAGLYSPALYFATSVIADVPLQAVAIAAECLVLYFLSGLYVSAGNFFVYFAVMFCLSQCAFAVGTMAGSAFRVSVLGAILIPLTLVPMMLVGGLLADNNQVRPYWIWLEKFSFIRHGHLLLLRNELESLGALSCDVARFGNATCARLPQSGPDALVKLGFGGEQDAAWVLWTSLGVVIFILKAMQLATTYIVSRTKF